MTATPMLAELRTGSPAFTSNLRALAALARSEEWMPLGYQPMHIRRISKMGVKDSRIVATGMRVGWDPAREDFYLYVSWTNGHPFHTVACTRPNGLPCKMPITPWDPDAGQHGAFRYYWLAEEPSQYGTFIIPS